MILKTLVFFIVCLLSILQAFSQFESCNMGKSDKIPPSEKPLQGKAFVNKYPNNELQFFSDWTPAEILKNGKTIVKNKMLRYNALTDEILWMRESDYQVIVLKRSEIDKIRFYSNATTKEFTFIKIDKKNIQHPNNSDMFVQLLSNQGEKVQLLKKIEAIEDPETYSVKQSTSYYLYINGEYKHLVQNKAFFFKLFGEHKPLIKQIMNDNNFLVKTEIDLIKAINMYNTKI